MKIVLDTNVLIFSTFWNGYSNRILELIEQKEIEAKKREFERKMPQRPLFVRSDEYRTLLGNIQSIEEKVEEVEALSKRLNEIKLVRDKETQKWRSMLEDINKRLHKIDKVMEQ